MSEYMCRHVRMACACLGQLLLGQRDGTAVRCHVAASATAPRLGATWLPAPASLLSACGVQLGQEALHRQKGVDVVIGLRSRVSCCSVILGVFQNERQRIMFPCSNHRTLPAPGVLNVSVHTRSGTFHSDTAIRLASALDACAAAQTCPAEDRPRCSNVLLPCDRW